MTDYHQNNNLNFIRELPKLEENIVPNGKHGIWLTDPGSEVNFLAQVFSKKIVSQGWEEKQKI